MTLLQRRRHEVSVAAAVVYDEAPTASPLSGLSSRCAWERLEPAGL